MDARELKLLWRIAARQGARFGMTAEEVLGFAWEGFERARRSWNGKDDFLRWASYKATWGVIEGLRSFNGRAERRAYKLRDPDHLAIGAVESREEDPAEEVLVRLELEELLDALGSRDREVLELRYLEGFNLKETGRRLGVSESRASQLEKRALARASGGAS